MDFGTGVYEVVRIYFSQRHRAFDSFRLGQLRSFSFGELKRGPTDAASLRVTVAPPPVLDEFRALHGFVFDRAGSILRQGDKDFATFLANERSRRLAMARVDFGYYGSPSWKTAEQVYTDLLRQLAGPGATPPGVLADTFREVERMHSIGQIADWQLENAREAYSSTVSDAGSKVGDAANWALGKAKDTLQSAAEQVRERATSVVAAYTTKDPTRAILIAAGAGALLMGLIAMMARSGVRTARRKIQR